MLKTACKCITQKYILMIAFNFKMSYNFEQYTECTRIYDEQGHCAQTQDKFYNEFEEVL